MADLGNRNASMRLQCGTCGWVPLEGMRIDEAALHFAVDHDTDKVAFELVAVCTCGEVMTHTESRPTGGGFKDYLLCGVCGNTGYIRREAGEAIPPRPG